MSSSVLSPQTQYAPLGADSIKESIEATIDTLITGLPKVEELSSEERRGIIARYSSVLESNFIYWMTAANLAIETEDARPIILENLREEVGDAHPLMLRKFAVAADAFPTAEDALAVDKELTAVRLFLGRLNGVQTLFAMAFLEGFIQKFMGYLGDLAVAQGSTELEYTEVHGVCDIGHTEGLFRASAIELAAFPLEAGLDPFEGVELLNALVKRIIYN